MAGSRNILTGAVALGLIALFFYLGKSGDFAAPNGPLSGIDATDDPNGSHVDSASDLRNRLLLPGATPAPADPTNTISQKSLRSFRVSEEAKREFFEAAHAQAHLPEDLTFVPIDLDMDQTVGIYGRNELYEFSVLAGRLNPTEEEIIEYLRSGDTGIPLVDRHGLARLSPQATSVPPIKGNGMQAAKYWTGRTKDGKEFRVGLMPREDGAGSYMMMMSGEAKVVEDSDDLFDSLYEGFKALPSK